MDNGRLSKVNKVQQDTPPRFFFRVAKHNNAREPGQAVSYVGLDIDKKTRNP